MKDNSFNLITPFTMGYVTRSLFSKSKPEKQKEAEPEILMKMLVERLAQNPTGKKEQEIIKDIQERAKKEAKAKRNFGLFFDYNYTYTSYFLWR